MCQVGHTCNCATLMSSVGNYIISSRFLWINTVFCPCYIPLFCNVMFAACSLPHNPYCWLLLSPVCMPYLLICTYVNTSPVACPPSFVLCKGLLWIWFYICVFVIYIVSLKCLGIVLFIIAMVPFHLLFLILGYIACISNFCLHMMVHHVCTTYVILWEICCWCVFLFTYFVERVKQNLV